MRLVFAPATSHSDSIARPGCSECGTATILVGIEAARPGYDLHTFQCLRARTLKLLGKPRGGRTLGGQGASDSCAVSAIRR